MHLLSKNNIDQKSHYHFFIDESGDHSLININKDFPYFTLCWILISDTEYKKLEQSIIDMKTSLFETNDVILHSRDIRKCEWYFSKLFDLNFKKDFYSRLNQTIEETNFQIISNTVQKESYIEKYWKSAVNPYKISLSYVLERMIFCLDGLQGKTIQIHIEKRGKKEDIELLKHYNMILDQGTYYVDPERFQSKIVECMFRKKYDNDIGIQIADLCAYPIISAIKNNDYSNPAYQVIENKIYINPKTGHKSWLKIIP